VIVILGAAGYVGHAFQYMLARQGAPYLAISRKQVDYTKYKILKEFLQETRPRFLINAAGFTGRPNVDACEVAKADTLHGNTLLPLTVSHACQSAGVRWGHVASGCIYMGAMINCDGKSQIEADLTKPQVRELLNSHSTRVQGFREDDPPNFSFRHPPCSFYSGTKALSEELLAEDEHVYLWRLRIPFDEHDHPRNYLTKLQRYSRIYENFNSLSHLGDFVSACLDLISAESPFGIYNVTNPGYVSSRQVVEMIRAILKQNRSFEYWSDDEEFYRVAAKTLRSNCILDVTKLLSTGIRIRPIEEALIAALENWKAQPDTRPGGERTHLRAAVSR